MKFDNEKIFGILLVLGAVCLPMFVQIPVLTDFYNTVYNASINNAGVIWSVIIIAALFVPRFIDLGGVSEFLESKLGLIFTIATILLLPAFFDIPYITVLYKDGYGWIIGLVNSVLIALGIKSNS